ncbi:MAG TPA: hypothetical protein DD672_00415 [Gammaproteobacteria bacterium]|jgi:hypothetical protein|nr:hypothetical protein [Gammaproteobacteria bacterium]|tara:strand:+ start:2432 stop:2794 length:363 start_codon:yes stop_codon:yes gene_type:complete
MMNEVERLEVNFKKALNAGDKAKLQEIHVSAMGFVERHGKPPVISASKKAYEQLIHAYICHVASSDAQLPYLLWWRAYYGHKKVPRKPQHSVARSRSHLREMKKHSQLTARLCQKYKIKT